VRVQTCKTLANAKFCRKLLKGIYLFWANLFQKLPILATLGDKYTFLKPQSVMMWTWETLPMPNLVKIAYFYKIGVGKGDPGPPIV